MRKDPGNLMNLLRYIGIPSRLRYSQIHHRKTIFIVILLLFIFSLFMEKPRLPSPGGGLLFQRGGDEVLLLQAHIGYLRKKLANAGVLVDINDPEMSIIYAITPTYARPEQMAELTRLCHSFLLVPNIHWILVEDARHLSPSVASFLKNCGVTHTHLNAPTPEQAKLKDTDPHWSKPRGVIQRNEGIHYLRTTFGNSPPSQRGVVYFADDDNTYTTEVFAAMRDTERVSVWPVGLVGGLLVEKPRLDQGKVIGWDVAWSPYRAFATDMAGFAVNLGLLLSKPKARFSYRVKIGELESEFIKHLVSGLSELEPKSPKKILVWHTRSKKANLEQELKLKVNLLPPSDANFVN